MIQQIRNSKVSKVIATYLALMIFVESTQPMMMFALTGGPSQPEFSAFTPIGTSDMVDLSSGDFNYNIPIMDVGGYPLNLAYNSGVTMDQEASWTGLGWNLSVGQIERQVRGLPDDFNGDKMIYENNMKPNTTIGGSVNVFVSPFGLKEAKASVGLGVKYNNYDGFGFSTSGGLSFDISKNLSVGMNLESSSTDGVSVSPSVSMNAKHTDKNNKETNLSGSLGISMNSRKGIESITGSAGIKDKNKQGLAGSGSLSFNTASFTPTKRVGMTSENVMFAINVGGAVMGIDPGIKFAGYRNTQGIKESEKFKVEKAFGYENTMNSGISDILDFNREKDRTVTKNTISLPVTNYTYDAYNVQGQGVSGMFRPYRSQVGLVHDNYTSDDSSGSNLGLEVGIGVGNHSGFDAAFTESTSSTGLWRNGNGALYRTLEKKDNKLNYEKVFFKNVGGFQVDKEDQNNNVMTKTGSYNPVSFKLGGTPYSRTARNVYFDNKTLAESNLIPGTQKIARDQYRLNRNQTIQKLNRKEAREFGFGTKYSPYSKKLKHDHHTSEIRILKDGGEHYIYGRAAYNSLKREVTFDVTDRQGDCNTGYVPYIPGLDNTPNNNQGGDQYFNRVTTPPYAHTFLLTSVLSSDYQDLGKKGCSDDDLGTYTKFSYTDFNKTTPYKWRVPYQQNQANFDEGLRSLKKDNKGNYIYGEKELLYIKKIETKTHIALFKISARKDGLGVKDENGGRNTDEDSKMWKLEKISLYSKPEYLANPNYAVPIKEAHFEYDYSLCKGIPNNSNEPATLPAELANQGGKLTLKKVYFTYGKSYMGKFTPYKFNYDYAPTDSNYKPNDLAFNTFNPNYNQKAYDIWGNYKPVEAGVGCETSDLGLSNTEFPFVNQSNKANADMYTSAWSLKSIELPSGGRMELSYESDDYRHVQDKDAMQMFKVVGNGSSLQPAEPTASNILYQNFTSNLPRKEFIYIKLDRTCTSKEDFYNRYLRNIENSPIYFRFLMNMTELSNPNSDKYDYVTGYMNLNINNDNDYNCFTANGQNYGAIRVDYADNKNPIAKAGYYFGRQYLNNVVYSTTGNEDVNDIKGVVYSLVNLIPQIFDIFSSPDQQLIDRNIASRFVQGKSWVRLQHPNPETGKLGGGCRVKEIKIHDQWDVMTGNDGVPVYKQFYGQQYSYKTAKNQSSGVATYEPLGCKENPLVQPFYDKAHKETILGPDTANYVEMPFGECFYPSPKVTYSRVTVKNLPREKTDASAVSDKVSKHATGTVVSEFFTSFDYPTISDLTAMDAAFDNSPVASLLNLYVETHLTMSQGFSIHTNDMDGKPKANWVYPEGQDSYISGVEYKYEQSNVNNINSGKLDNKVVTIDKKGVINKRIVGVDYDVINDFRENKSVTETSGIEFNTEGLPLLFVYILVPVPLPSYSYHENKLNTTTTTKVIHTSGILRETIAYDVGSSRVSTKNLAWNADTGDVMVTETVNEYNDKYYSLNFPAYWANPQMGQASQNLGLESGISNIGTDNNFKLNGSYSASDYLVEGDQLYIKTPLNRRGFKAWVVMLSGNTFRLIDSGGLLIKSAAISATGSSIKVIKSGYRNMQSASMASVTAMKNPLYNSTVLKTNIDDTAVPPTPQFPLKPFQSTTWDQNRIVNASAIEYKQIWPAQCDCNLPKMDFLVVNNIKTEKLQFEYEKNSTDDFDKIEDRSYNPYLYNILGNWRAVKSYAYLTGRNSSTDPTPRKDGFFKDFVPFYVFNGTNWVVNNSLGKWQFASQVAAYNPYGQEIENKDALDRSSSALFGYNNRFPTAVASNSRYRDLASDGFEDYDSSDCGSKAHFNFENVLKPYEISISEKEAHTGRRSIRIEASTSETSPRKANVRKKVTPCDPIAPLPKPVANKIIKK